MAVHVRTKKFALQPNNGAKGFTKFFVKPYFAIKTKCEKYNNRNIYISVNYFRYYFKEQHFVIGM